MRRALIAVFVLSLLSASTVAKKPKKRKTIVPPAAMQHHQRGVLAHVQGDNAGAKSAFRQAIAAKPDFAYAYFRLGFILQEEQQKMSPRAGSGRQGKPIASRTVDSSADSSPAATHETELEDSIPLFRCIALSNRCLHRPHFHFAHTRQR